MRDTGAHWSMQSTQLVWTDHSQWSRTSQQNRVCTYEFGLECALKHTNKNTRIHTYAESMSHTRALAVPHIHEFCVLCVYAPYSNNLKKRLFGVRAESQTVSKYIHIHTCVDVFSVNKIAFVCARAQRSNEHSKHNDCAMEFFVSFLKETKHQYIDAMQSGNLAGLKWSMIRTILFRIEINMGFFCLFFDTSWRSWK